MGLPNRLQPKPDVPRCAGRRRSLHPAISPGSYRRRAGVMRQSVPSRRHSDATLPCRADCGRIPGRPPKANRNDQVADDGDDEALVDGVPIGKVEQGSYQPEITEHPYLIADKNQRSVRRVAVASATPAIAKILSARRAGLDPCCSTTANIDHQPQPIRANPRTVPRS